MRQDPIFEDQVVRHRQRNDHRISPVRLQRGVQEARLRRLQLARIAAAAFDVEEQIVPIQQLGYVGLQGDEICRVLGIAADRDRAGHVPVDQPERAAEEIDPGRDDRRSHAVVIEDQRLDEVIEMALVIGDVDDAAAASGLLRDGDVLVEPFDFSQDGIERVFQGAVDRVALRRPELVEVGVDPLAGVELRLAVSPRR